MPPRLNPANDFAGSTRETKSRKRRRTRSSVPVSLAPVSCGKLCGRYVNRALVRLFRSSFDRARTRRFIASVWSASSISSANDAACVMGRALPDQHEANTTSHRHRRRGATRANQKAGVEALRRYTKLAEKDIRRLPTLAAYCSENRSVSAWNHDYSVSIRCRVHFLLRGCASRAWPTAQKTDR